MKAPKRVARGTRLYQLTSAVYHPTGGFTANYVRTGIAATAADADAWARGGIGARMWHTPSAESVTLDSRAN